MKTQAELEKDDADAIFASQILDGTVDLRPILKAQADRIMALRVLLRDALVAGHQTGSLRDHSDPTIAAETFIGPIERCEDSLCVDGLALLAAPMTVEREPSLDTAWAEAEAALPKGWAIESIRREWYPPTAPARWWVRIFEPVEEGRNTTTKDGPDGPTPAAALHALAAKLRGADR